MKINKDENPPDCFKCCGLLVARPPRKKEKEKRKEKTPSRKPIQGKMTQPICNRKLLFLLFLQFDKVVKEGGRRGVGGRVDEIGGENHQ